VESLAVANGYIFDAQQWGPGLTSVTASGITVRESDDAPPLATADAVTFDLDLLGGRSSGRWVRGLRAIAPSLIVSRDRAGAWSAARLAIVAGLPVAELRIDGGRVEVRDEGLSRTLQIDDVNAVVVDAAALAGTGDGVRRFDANGRFGSGKLAVTGTMLAPQFEMTVNVENVPLSVLAPASGLPGDTPIFGAITFASRPDVGVTCESSLVVRVDTQSVPLDICPEGSSPTAPGGLP
jgi:hypothetical protein